MTTEIQYSFGRVIQAMNVEFLVNEAGLWAYKIHCPKPYVGATNQVIQSAYKFPYASMAVGKVETPIELYYMSQSCD